MHSFETLVGHHFSLAHSTPSPHGAVKGSEELHGDLISPQGQQSCFCRSTGTAISRERGLPRHCR